MKLYLKSKIISDPAVFALMKGRSMYGWGARYGEYVADKFIKAKGAFIGFEPDDNPEVFDALLTPNPYDLVYLKALGTTSTRLCVMGVGFFVNDKIYQDDELGIGRKINWLSDDEIYLPAGWQNDKFRNHRLGTIYQEFSPRIQRRIIDIFLNPEEYDGEV